MQALYELDSNILLWIQNNIRIEFLNTPVKLITSLANYGLLWIILTVLFLFIPKYRLTGLMSAAAMIVNSLAVNALIKHIVARTRPYEVIETLTILIERQPDTSFPSGHASVSFAAAVVLFRNCDKRIGITALILASLIALSRLYVGVHYPSDVICGVIAGILCGLAGEFIVKKLQPVLHEKFSKNAD